MDTVQYGGDSALKNIAIGTGVIVGGAITLKVIGRIIRKIRGFPPALPGPKKILQNGLDAKELQQAEEAVSFRKGGTFVGAPDENYRGIDGWLNGTPVSLKYTDGLTPQKVFKRLRIAKEKALKHGEYGVEVYIKAPNASAKDLIYYASRHQKPHYKDAISFVSVNTKDGWVTLKLW